MQKVKNAKASEYGCWLRNVKLRNAEVSECIWNAIAETCKDKKCQSWESHEKHRSEQMHRQQNAWDIQHIRNAKLSYATAKKCIRNASAKDLICFLHFCRSTALSCIIVPGCCHCPGGIWSVVRVLLGKHKGEFHTGLRDEQAPPQW